MRCEIIGVGTELLMGQTTNTNARDISRELSALGVGVYYQSVVGDNRERLEEVFKCALERVELVILTGGLGPTSDDITRDTVTEVLGLSLEKNEEWEQRLEEFFKRLGRTMVESNRRQALIPQGAILLPNHRGTAPGIYLEKEGRTVVMLPGPPRELFPMFREQVIPRLQAGLEERGNLAVLKSKVLRVIGLGESAMAEQIQPILEAQENPTIAPLAKGTEVHLRITARAAAPEEADRLISAKVAEIREALGDHVYGEDDEKLEFVVARLLLESGQTVALAESCSGGLLSHRLTNVPGSSSYLLGGFVTYSNEAKIEVLGVEKRLLEAKGAVSAEVASMMAEGARKLCGANIGVGITGIAGPGGETPEKPVGLTYIALSAPGAEFARRYEFWGSRLEVKERASQTALHLLRLYLLGKIA